MNNLQKEELETLIEIRKGLEEELWNAQDYLEELEQKENPSDYYESEMSSVRSEINDLEGRINDLYNQCDYIKNN